MAKKSIAGSGLRSNKLIFGIIVILVLLVFAGSLTFLKNIYQTETYYVLNQDVATRTQITTDMLSPVVTQAGTAPQSALGISDVQSGDLYSQYPLSSGDIITPSNVSGFEDISVGIPDTWVVTNFSVNADNAVGGRIKRGTYFDILVNGDNGSFYPFVNVLALDTTVSLSNASSSNAADTSEAHDGQTTQYVVGMPPADAARLQNLVKVYGTSLNLVLSPRANEYSKPDIKAYTGLFTFGSNTAGENSSTPKNMGENTDYTFKSLKRDEFGRPVSQDINCSQGNAKIPADSETGQCPEGLSSDASGSESSNSTTSSSASPSPSSSATTEGNSKSN
jgi:hypothetical protein